MNKDNVSMYMSVICALQAGKIVEFKNYNGLWTPFTELVFLAPPERYRIKPEPLECYMCVESGYESELHTKETAEFYCKNKPNYKIFHMREVIE